MEDLSYYDLHSDRYFKTIEYKTKDELTPSNVKVLVLNNLKSMLEELLNTELTKEIPDDYIVQTINTNLMVLEDAYTIELYKFQFSALKSIIGTEIKNIKDLMNLT